MGKKLFMFDLDNTLIKTNRANNESYKEAIQTVTGKTLKLESQRFTRVELSQIMPDLSDTQISEIVMEKERCYEKFISETILNKQLANLLVALNEEGCETVLLTESCKKRAEQLCNYYLLTKCFSSRYFKEDYPNSDKYSFLKQRLSTLQSIILFENDPLEISRAISNGIPEKSIIVVNF